MGERETEQREIDLINGRLESDGRALANIHHKINDLGLWIKHLIDRDGARALQLASQEHRLRATEAEAKKLATQLENIYSMIWKTLLWIALGSTSLIGSLAWPRIIGGS